MKLDARFRGPTRAWFEGTFERATLAQTQAFGPILSGESTLLFAPTGSGKTLAAFLAAIDGLLFDPVPEPGARCRILYVSPLKSLAVDVERNLRAPLVGITEAALRAGQPFHTPRIAVRSGDTPAKERAAIVKSPPDILITTPESLCLMLTSRAREGLASVRTVIVDEIHAMAATKRGAHFFLGLERLEAVRGERPPLQRIGLSATQRPLDEVARLLGGFGDDGVPRPVTIVDAGRKRETKLHIEMPAAELPGAVDEDQPTRPASAWETIVPRLSELVLSHRTTMIFVNSRRLAERITQAINEHADREIALAHHGSLSREERSRAEEALKSGELPCIVATASMELGLDIGAVELVVQIESPPSVSSGLQRVGRSNHAVTGVPEGILIPKHKGDLVACTAALRRMRSLEVEATFYPRNPLDVLSQHVVGMVAVDDWNVEELFALVRRAAPFAELPRASFDGVLDMLAGRYPSTEFAELAPRIVWDRPRGGLRARKGARLLAVTNVGTIPDRGLYTVALAEQEGKTSRRVGELDEEMVFETRQGEVILLGASSWRVAEITRDKVLVTPAPGEPGKMPFWRGDGLGRSLELGMAVGALVRSLGEKTDVAARASLEGDLDGPAVDALLEYVGEQKEATRALPSDRTLVVERFRDELGDYRVCLLSPLGNRVHAPLAMCIRSKAMQVLGLDVEPVTSDDGIVFRFQDVGAPPDLVALFPSADEAESMLMSTLGDTSLFAGRFREAAGRALLLPRRMPGKRTPLWAQRKRAADLLAVAVRYPSFPILLETYRECMRDVFDLRGLVDVLRKVESRSLKLTTVDTRTPSPFAASLLFSYAGNFMYDSDSPVAERRAQALSIDTAQLRELLGEAALRDLLDPAVLADTERKLQRFGLPVKDADGVHDLLRRLGDLTEAEILARAENPADVPSHLAALEEERRALRISLRGEPRLIAVEDAGLYEQALGASLPRGVPDVFRRPREEPLEEIAGRYARTHGPFRIATLVARYGAAAATVTRALRALEARHTLLRGEFIPGGEGEEYCDAEVLRIIKRRTLAALRSEIEPVAPEAYATLLGEWHGITQPSDDPDALMRALDLLEGYPLHLEELEDVMLPARLRRYRSGDLDLLLSSGLLRWVGLAEAGKIALYRADTLHVAPPPVGAVEGERAAQIREHLRARGASFFADLERAIGGFRGDLSSALWEMVWAGEVTNDTLAPLRSKRGAKPPRGRERRGHPGPLRHLAPRTGAPGTEGRWSLSPHHPAWAEAAGSATEGRVHLTRILLGRYAVLTRESVNAEGVAGGFSGVYEVLRQLEERAQIRRGYFIATLGAAQFALPGVEDRLRARDAHAKDAAPVVLAATDPANPYGATFPWPPGLAPGAPSPQRAQGAVVILHEGRPLAWLGRGDEHLVTFPSEDGRAFQHVAAALAALVQSGRRRGLLLTHVDGAPASTHSLAVALRDAGFVRAAGSLVLRPGSPRPGDGRRVLRDA